MHFIQFSQFHAKPMSHRQIQWTKVLIERQIDQILSKINKFVSTYPVNIEEKCVLIVGWWLHVRYPVQPFCYNFYRSAKHRFLFLRRRTFHFHLTFPLILGGEGRFTTLFVRSVRSLDLFFRGFPHRYWIEILF